MGLDFPGGLFNGGAAFPIEVSPAGTGASLCAQIAALDKRFAADRVMLVHNAKVLPLDAPLSALKAGDKLTFVLRNGAPPPPPPPPPPQAPPSPVETAINVKVDGAITRDIKVPVKPGMTVGEVKAFVLAALPDLQGQPALHLSFNAKVLEDARPLSAYNIEPPAELRGTLNLNGGMPSPKARLESGGGGGDGGGGAPPPAAAAAAAAEPLVISVISNF